MRYYTTSKKSSQQQTNLLIYIKTIKHISQARLGFAAVTAKYKWLKTTVVHFSLMLHMHCRLVGSLSSLASLRYSGFTIWNVGHCSRGREDEKLLLSTLMLLLVVTHITLCLIDQSKSHNSPTLRKQEHPILPHSKVEKSQRH